MTKLLTTQGFADFMGWTVHAVYMRRYRGGSLPPEIRIGSTVRYRMEDIEHWLASHTQDPDDDSPSD
jgi:predicted DNA-binding transcriptional regulator AlpA